MAAGALTGQTSLLSPDRIGLPRYPQADNDDYLLCGVKAAEKSWFGRCQNTRGPGPFHGSTIGPSVRNQDLIHGAATGLFSGCPPRRFGHTFTADFALVGRVVNISRGMAPSASAAAEYQHALTGTNAPGQQVNNPSSSWPNT